MRRATLRNPRLAPGSGGAAVDTEPFSRRAFLGGAAALGAALFAGCTSDEDPGGPAASRSPSSLLTPSASPIECPATERGSGADPLWDLAIRSGLVYGSSAATWQLSDPEYRRLYTRHSAILFTEDDLLWYRLRPTPDADLDFRFGDRIVGFAEDHGLVVLGAHLMWDEGYGEGWAESDFYELDRERARDLLFGTIDATVRRYRGRVAAWIAANEVADGFGIRAEVPWHSVIGETYIEEGFHVAHEADPDAMLLINDFGFETGDGISSAEDRRAVALRVLDDLLAKDVPVHGFGVQAHLTAGEFEEAFDAAGYVRFLQEVAQRGLPILITEMDVLDDGLPPSIEERDRAVAEVYRRYLGAALEVPAVASLITFGLSDRYTWLQEDFPRDDGAARRPLPFDDRMRPKPAGQALRESLGRAAVRSTPRELRPPRCRPLEHAG